MFAKKYRDRIKPRICTKIALVCTVVFSLSGYPAGAIAQNNYDGYYNYIGTWPDQVDTYYAEDVQGLAHSDDKWFITNQVMPKVRCFMQFP